jgi:hypothetical protein
MDFLAIDDHKTFSDTTCFLIEEAAHYAPKALSPAGSDWESPLQFMEWNKTLKKVWPQGLSRI